MRENTGADFTAKDYRTWAGSVLALAALRKLKWETVTEARKHIVGVINQVSKLMHNTPAVCRRCYVHPAVIEAFEVGALPDPMSLTRRRGLRADEVALLIFLENDAKRHAKEVAHQSRKGHRIGRSAAHRVAW